MFFIVFSKFNRFVATSTYLDRIFPMWWNSGSWDHTYTVHGNNRHTTTSRSHLWTGYTGGWKNKVDWNLELMEVHFDLKHKVTWQWWLFINWKTFGSAWFSNLIFTLLRPASTILYKLRFNLTQSEDIPLFMFLNSFCWRDWTDKDKVSLLFYLVNRSPLSLKALDMVCHYAHFKPVSTV